MPGTPMEQPHIICLCLDYCSAICPGGSEIQDCTRQRYMLTHVPRNCYSKNPKEANILNLKIYTVKSLILQNWLPPQDDLFSPFPHTYYHENPTAEQNIKTVLS